MPFFGLGIHFLIALFFAVHAIKTGRQMYWLIILFSFPLLGSIVYFLVEYLPSSKVERSVKQVSNMAAQILDPSRELREAKEAFELSPTVQNRMRLAAALDNAGEYAEAAAQFDACLNSPFASDPEVRFGAARAKLHVQQAAPAITLLQQLKAEKPEFRPEQVSLLLAQCFAANGANESAQAEFVYALNTFGSAEVRGEYALWAAKAGDVMTAERLKAELDKDWQRWNKHSRSLHKDLFSEIEKAIANAKKAG